MKVTTDARCHVHVFLDTSITAPPAKVSNTKTSEQARKIAEQLKKSAKDKTPCDCNGTIDSNYTGGGSKFNEVKRQLALLGISIKNNTEWEEYIVGGSYHTDDLKDALDTGLAMAKKKSVTK